MSELSVLDVQRALREFAEHGHDVLQHPHQVHLDDKRYGMVVGTGLFISQDSNNQVYKNLHSQLFQAERPLISEIDTTNYNPINYRTFVTPLRRMISKYSTMPDVHSYHVTQPHLNNDYEHRGFFPNRGIYRDEPNFHADAHEALQAHTTEDVPTGGGVTFYESGRHLQKRAMTNEEHKTFNDRFALQELTHPAPPFSGLISVKHIRNIGNVNHTSLHVYDPKTEQLLKVS